MVAVISLILESLLLRWRRLLSVNKPPDFSRNEAICRDLPLTHTHKTGKIVLGGTSLTNEFITVYNITEIRRAL